MPEGTRVHRCVDKLVKEGYTLESAIRICQESTKQSYKTGKPLKNKKKKKKQ